MRRPILALALLAAYLAAPSCQPEATTRFEPAALVVAPGSIVSASVMVDTSRAIRAWEFDVASSNPSVARILDIQPHADFDDDGVLFRPPTVALALGQAHNAVDVRHAGLEATGSFGAATVYVWAVAPGSATISVIGGGLATSDGNAVGSTLQKLYLTVTP